MDELLIIQRYILEVYNSRFYMKFRYQINRSFQQSRYLSYSLLQRKITYSLDLLNLHELLPDYDILMIFGKENKHINNS